jgi:hypothetical protein
LNATERAFASSVSFKPAYATLAISQRKFLKDDWQWLQGLPGCSTIMKILWVPPFAAA